MNIHLLHCSEVVTVVTLFWLKKNGFAPVREFLILFADGRSGITFY